MLKKSLSLMIVFILSLQCFGVFAETLPDSEENSYSWTSWEDKSYFKDGEYKVESYSYVNETMDKRNYRVEFDLNINEGKEYFPAIWLRADENMNGYRFSFDVKNNSVKLEKVNGEKKVEISSGSINLDEKIFVYAEVNGEKISFGTKGKEIFSAVDYKAVEKGGFAVDCGDGKITLENLKISFIKNPDDEYYVAHPNEDYKRSSYSESIEKAVVLGFMKSADEKGRFLPFADITRGEFAEIIFKMLKAESGNSSAVEDMTKDDEYYNEASFCVNNGYIRTDNGCFNPDEPMLYGDAVRAMALITGRKLSAGIADRNENYYSLAFRAGIIKSFPANEALSREKCAKLVIDTAKVSLVEFTTVVAGGEIGVSSGYEERKGKNILGVYHDIYEHKGRVEQNSRSGLYSNDGCDENTVVIGGLKVKSMGTDISEYLGYYVESYVKEISKGEYGIVWFNADDDKNEPIEISAEDISEKTTTERLVYYEGNRAKEVNLPKNLIYIYNGVVTSPQDAILKPEVGSVTLISADDGYFAVVIASFETVMVGSISYYSGEVRDKYYDDKIYTFDDNCTYKIYSGGKEIPLTSVYANYILSIAESQGTQKHYTVYSSVKRETGVYKSSNYDGYKIGGKEYKLLSYGQELYDGQKVQKPQIGQSVTVYEDYFGNAALILPESMYESIGYLTAIGRSSGINGNYETLIFKSDGEWLKTKFADNLKIDGTQASLENGSSSAVYSGGKCIPQPVKYKLNGKGEVVELSTPQESAFGSAPITKGASYKNKKYVSGNTSFDSALYLSWDTIVFGIPSNIAKREDFVAGKRTYFTDGGLYNVTSYNVDDFWVSGLVVVEQKATAEVSKLPRAVVIDEITECLSDDGNIINVLNGYQSGKKISVKIREDVADTFKAFKRGDTIFAANNELGEIAGFKKLYLSSELPVYSKNPGASQSVDSVVVTGKVTKINSADKRALVDVGSGEGSYYLGNAVSVYIYYKNSDILETGSVGSIDVGDFVVFNFSWSKLNDVIIYKQ